MKTNLHTSIITAVLALLVFTSGANAALVSELGKLDLNGINPNTGSMWAAGDTYRLIFASSAGRDATSTDIADYNTFIEGLTGAAGLGTGWKALASTATVAARDNTETNGAVDGPGESIWLVNGTTLVADNYADLYGSNTRSSAINRSETGGAPLDTGQFTSLWTGSDGGGDIQGSDGLGAVDGTSRTGLWNFTSDRHWIQRFSVDNTVARGLYGLSDVLTVTDDGTVAPDNINVPNFSFEDGTTGWTGGFGTFNPNITLLSPVNGSSVAFHENSGDIITDGSLGLIEEGKYTLTVAVGNRSDSIREPGDYRIEILGDGNLLAFAELLDGDINIANGAMVDLMLMYEATAADVGKSLSLRLVHSNGRQGQFDNVRLDFLAPNADIPEPATATLAMLGLGGIVMRRRRNVA